MLVVQCFSLRSFLCCYHELMKTIEIVEIYFPILKVGAECLPVFKYPKNDYDKIFYARAVM